MRHLSIAVIAAASTVTFAQIVSAADLPVKAPAYRPPIVVPYSWTGCFIGGNVGGLWAHKDWRNGQTPTDPGAPLGSHHADNWLGGVQGGCDYQFTGSWVVGIQGDYDWTDAKGSSVDAITPDTTDNTKIKWLASVTGRVGYSWNRFLGYVKGGGAWARDNYFIRSSVDGFIISDANATRSGWTVGVGGEYAFYDWLSVFAEYDYYDFGTRTNTFMSHETPGVVDTIIDVKEHDNVFKVGLNLRWGYLR